MPFYRNISGIISYTPNILKSCNRNRVDDNAYDTRLFVYLFITLIRAFIIKCLVFTSKMLVSKFPNSAKKFQCGEDF
jgi:hypothetical protein